MNLRDLSRTLKRELKTYQLVARDPRTPKSSRWLLGAAIGYVLMPFDLIPDFIPIIGHLDDAVIVPGLIMLAMRKVPHEVVEQCREQAGRGESGPSDTTLAPQTPIESDSGEEINEEK